MGGGGGWVTRPERDRAKCEQHFQELLLGAIAYCLKSVIVGGASIVMCGEWPSMNGDVYPGSRFAGHTGWWMDVDELPL